MSEQDPTDLILVDRIRKGDKKAFRILFDRYYQRLLAVAINLLGDINAAKDAVQEVFLSLWRSREKLNIHTSLEAFLKRSTINRCLNLIKARKHFVPEAQLKELPNTDNPVQLLEAQDLEGIVQDALDNLPERCRLIFILRRMEGLSHKEIAKKLDISTKTVENQMTKALKELKNAVQPYLSDQRKADLS